MSLRDAIKDKICINILTANYPMGDFVHWVAQKNINLPLLVLLLDCIQKELDAEVAKQSCRSCLQSRQQLFARYWCLYCGQVRAYYKAVLNDPACKEQLSFLLR